MSLPAQQQPLISLHALTRARTTVEDFSLSYLPLHGQEPHAGLLRYLDVLVFVSAALYELDEQNERLCASGPALGELAGCAVLKDALRERGLLNAPTERELEDGASYWALERRLCSALARCESISETDVARAHACKSFDYRVLHHVLLQLLRVEPDEPLLAFLRLDERLVDIGDDLTDYEDDVCANSFNLLRGLVSLHGVAEAPLRLVAMVGELERQHAAALQALPEAQRLHFWARHQEASAQPRSERWVLPKPIAIEDEAEFRCRFAHADGA